MKTAIRNSVINNNMSTSYPSKWKKNYTATRLDHRILLPRLQKHNFFLKVDNTIDRRSNSSSTNLVLVRSSNISVFDNSRYQPESRFQELASSSPSSSLPEEESCGLVSLWSIFRGRIHLQEASFCTACRKIAAAGIVFLGILAVSLCSRNPAMASFARRRRRAALINSLYHTCDGGCSGYHFNEISAPIFLIGFFAFAVYMLSHFLDLAIINYRRGSAFFLQIGILDKEHIFQRKLNRIAETADTSISMGWIHELKDVLEALLQHCDSCHFSSLFEKSGQYMERSTKPFFRELLRKQRKKFEKVRFVNVDDVHTKRATVHKANSGDNEYVVVTILVLARGRYSLPSLKLSAEHIKSILQALCSLPANKIEAVEVLWTPQSEDDILSEQVLCKDFPLMERLPS